MFGVTAAYHRYFSHRSFRTGRLFQFLLAVLATTSAQLGPLWWAATHRHHHANSDTEQDPHSPRHYGFLWSHMGWFLHPGNRRDNLAGIRDYARFPELVFIDRWALISPALLGTATFALGRVLAEAGRPTSGAQMLVWGFFISTVLLYHGTYTINSLSHVFGSQRFDTGDDSRNNLLAGADHPGRGLAQQPSPLPVELPPGHLLVGDRYHLSHPAGSGEAWPGVGSAAGAGQGVRPGGRGAATEPAHLIRD
jgi:stearoyl-CoA desaturase (delta-9 desaturase)